MGSSWSGSLARLAWIDALTHGAQNFARFIPGLVNREHSVRADGRPHLLAVHAALDDVGAFVLSVRCTSRPLRDLPDI